MIKKSGLWLLIVFFMLLAFVVSNYYGQYLDIYILFTFPALLAAWIFNFWSGFLVVVINLNLLLYLELIYKVWKPISFTIIELVIRFFIMIVLVYLVDKIRRKLASIELESRKDSLTGLLNRRGLFEFGEYEIQRVARTKEPLTVVMFDIDNFKKINDTLGHVAGDAVLKSIGGVFHQHLRQMDAAARYGGDEFALILPITKAARAKQVVNRLIGLINKKLPDSPSGISVTVGCCTMTANSQLSFKALFKATDDFMYEGKKTGKNQVLYKEV